MKQRQQRVLFLKSRINSARRVAISKKKVGKLMQIGASISNKKNLLSGSKKKKGKKMRFI